MFDCCSGANFLEAEETFLNHKTVLEEAGVNTNELNGLDATHYQILEPITQVLTTLIPINLLTHPN